MSTIADNENCIPDSQEIYCEKSENLIKNVNQVGCDTSGALNESQDFHLFDVEDSEDLLTNKSNSSSERFKQPDAEEVSDITEPAAFREGTREIEIKVDHTLAHDKKEVSEGSNTEVTSIDEIAKCKEKTSDDEEDIIHGTPPEIHSPSKRQASNLASATQKRKAEAFDEPACKILKSSSLKDNPIFDRDRSEEVNEARPIDPGESKDVIEDSQILEKMDDCLHKNSTNLIIAESQDAEDEVEMVGEKIVDSVSVDESINKINQEEGGHTKETESFEKQKREEVSVIDKESKTPSKTDAKDENLNDSLKLYRSVANETNNEEKVINVNTIGKSDSIAESLKQIDSQECLPPDDNGCRQVGALLEKKEEKLNEGDTTKASLPEAEQNHSKARDDITKNKQIDNNEILNDNNITSQISKSNETLSKIDNSNTKVGDGDNFKAELTAGTEIEPPVTVSKSRMSIEVIYDRNSDNQENKSKPRQLIEIDEDGEKLVLDSSQEEKSCLDNTKTDSNYKSCNDTKSSGDFSYKSVSKTTDSSSDSKMDGLLINGSEGSRKTDTDGTASVKSDISVSESSADNVSEYKGPKESSNSPSKKSKLSVTLSKDENPVVVNVSDSENDSSVVEESKNKSLLDASLTRNNSMAKVIQVEKEINVCVKLRCLLQLEETTKDIMGKEILSVQCESMGKPSNCQRSEDTTGSLADISGNDNKDMSLGSVTSNTQPYHLVPSRFSLLSTVSSSSASSAASLAQKMAAKDESHFPLPRGPAKHKKIHDAVVEEKQDEVCEHPKDWKNVRLLTTSILNWVSSEFRSVDLHNGGTDQLDDPLRKIRSSTPEIESDKKEDLVQITTPKSSKKGRATKRVRSRSSRRPSRTVNSKVSPSVLISPSEQEETATRAVPKKSRKGSVTSDIPASKITTPVEPSVTGEYAMRSVPQRRSTTPQNVPQSESLIGREVFAKWSDNNYYPGMVKDKSKEKYKVNFYDGKSKLLLESFVIPIPKMLNERLSVYVTTKDDYGSPGIIMEVETVQDEVYYIVESDEGEMIRAQIKDIFLTPDQAQVLREQTTVDTKSLLLSPQHLGQVSLDNMVDGKRRSKRIGTPHFSTPTRPRQLNLSMDKSIDVAEPSSSGVTPRASSKEKVQSESEHKTSGFSSSDVDETHGLSGVQPEIPGTLEELVKGPQSRIKGKQKSKKKADDQETIALLGPIPRSGSNIFKGLSFILTCASLESMDKYKMDSQESNSDPGTENEEEWSKKPFARDRLKRQLTAGGGKVYDNFEQIPQDEYGNTKLITNVPNLTAKSIQCLSVGIHAYNHNWVIRCCQQNKLVNAAEDELPAGWSLDKRNYVEMYQRTNQKPLTHFVVVIPIIRSDNEFVPFWRQICENAGATVLLTDKPGSNLIQGSVVLTNHKCPTWLVEKANSWSIPLVSTTWIVQCLIEGKLCPHDTQASYKYDYIKA
ncbi:TP53-binding protein 1 [Orussus abietinus]|uniref:TP53-binding protein 1 n=1 Tax=Orussus abietinus TaxID=222816 RepID=UPI0006250EFF|nr:TP53-binding protein 1 [Orussus abietinus]XP_012276834.1 TP53-binding protein 1 [Orussus abietinus]XP_012276836.1 TP53-binding protein 1 [Orussus abietinus]